MQLAEHDSYVQLLLEKPYDERALESVYVAMGRDPRAYASLLVRAAETTSENVPASHWLTEAARVKVHALRDESDGVRLLEAALERDPLNLRAAEHMVELYRVRGEDRELAQLLKSRADGMRQSYQTERVTLPHAALAFEKLSGVYEAIGDSSCALDSLRTALELERARGRATAPSPPPDGPPESALRSREADSVGPGALPPEPRWSAGPARAPNDTVPSPVPSPPEAGPPRETLSEPADSRRTTRPPTLLPTTPPPAVDPLLSVIEALHALRRIDDVVEGAALVLKTALSAIPSAAGLVHLADTGAREFVVVAAAGTRNTELVGARTPESDLLLDKALRDTDSLVVPQGSLELATTRFGLVSPERSVLCAPAQYDGQKLGAIELVDPQRTATFTAADRHAMTYVGERFAEFLADRSISF
jgi:hypothetical protein